MRTTQKIETETHGATVNIYALTFQYYLYPGMVMHIHSLESCVALSSDNSIAQAIIEFGIYKDSLTTEMYHWYQSPNNVSPFRNAFILKLESGKWDIKTRYIDTTMSATGAHQILTNISYSLMGG